ncbi:hypothetical protein LIT38_20290 [Bacillus sp. CMF12]|uniref:hypothetical protein n=1 Tax=Bacillus sp. CMF12 TaxID=2884834 RepID=UPI002079E037|nr:hypothetical protein [Bacillus sp. CMF12]USK48851.1 hypothetical protein LIT38_20290 [Bacillus sp. CMF12]
MDTIKVRISSLMDLSIIKIAALSFAAAIFLYFSFFFMDKLPSNYWVDNYASNFYSVRQSTLNFLFRAAPFFITIVVAITSLTINTYSGTFLELLINDKRIKLFISFSIFYLIYHIIVIFFVDSGLANQTEKLNDYYVKYFCIYFFDFLFALCNSLFTLYTAYHVFQYSWPLTLKKKFLKNITRTIGQVDNNFLVSEKELSNYKNDLSQHIGLFINLLNKAIKSKDYDSVRGTIKDISNIWTEIVSYTNESKKQKADEQFRALISEISQENTTLQLGFQFDFAGDVYDIGLSKIAHVYSDAFEIAFTNSEYYSCEIILESVYDLTKAEGINEEDIRKCLKILVNLFDISLRVDKKGQTSYFSSKILSLVSEIYYNRRGFKDFDIFYDLIFVCLILDDHKNLKEALYKFRESFNNEGINNEIHYDTLRQFQSTFIFCLKNKKMKCYGELLRFFVIGKMNLEIFNGIISENIVIIDDDLDFLQELIEELSEPSSNNEINYNEEIYFRIKLYITWYSYYLLQCRISKERINYEHRDIDIPITIKGKMPFDLIRTLLIDLETHEKNWGKLFVNQEKYYFTQVAMQLIKPNECKNFDTEIKEYGASDYLNTCKNIADKNSTT